jgi:hypothetical protein
METTEQVFVALLNEGTGVWRPVPATRIKKNVFRLEGSVPSDEEWEFLPGQLVECEQKVFSGGSSGLVAIRVTQPK